MFETAEVGNTIEKAAYVREVPKLRQQLLDLQKKLAESRRSLIVLVGGVEGGGKSETVNILLEWLDARGIAVHALWEPTDEERERPAFWRFWRVLPMAGRAAIFIGSWYTQPIIERAFGRLKRRAFGAALDRIVSFEQMLSRENVVIVKFWMHLSEKAQRMRLRQLAKNPDERWRVTEADWRFHKNYRRFRETSEEALRRSNHGQAPWHIIEATDWRFRNLTVGRILANTLRRGLSKAAPVVVRAKLPKPAKVNLLNRLKLNARLEEEYEKEARKFHGCLGSLTRRLHDAGRSGIFVFEGPDAAGKGGTIRFLTHAMDARNYQVISVAAPTEEERGHPYLWRFWRHLPRHGRVTIYDRSWYGRVLVERVEGFAAPEAWKRAYAEINEFEAQLTDSGLIVHKFWLAISAQEQLRRFKDREITPYKQYKITEEDWRNRAKWGAYEAAACEMIEQTGTSNAPWTIVEADDKRFARIKVIKTVCARLSDALG